MKYSGKLELTWVNKKTNLDIEPRILVEDAKFSYGDKESPNMIIHGDNLVALKALHRDYANRIKCIYIDPPYNTGSAFEQYDDNVEHSIWLNLMYSRVILLRDLLTDDGTIWISLDDNEAHYLKVVCDEIFGRKNFIADVAWEKVDSPRMDSKLFSSRYDHTLVYAKEIEKVQINRLPVEEVPEHYDKVSEDGRKYYLKPLRYMGNADSRADRPNLYFGITAPDGIEVFPKKNDGTDGRWRWSKERVEENFDRIEFVKGRNGWSVYSRIYAQDDATRPPETLWNFLDAGSNRNAKAEIKALFKNDKVFDTPKPEKLISLILTVSTSEGDYVLDSFLGSGTTTAVAHKMNRKYIGIEMGEHAYSVCVPRMKMVIDGEQGGISKNVSWKGGGGYKFYELAEPLLVKNPIIPVYDVNPSYTFEMVCEAICKIEAFTYAPAGFYHGHSTENRFIHVTFEFVNGEYVSELASKLSDKQSLIIYCLKHQRDIALPDNIEIRRIPKDIQDKCNFESEDE